MAANPTSSNGSPNLQETPHPQPRQIQQQAQIKICRLQHCTDKLRSEALQLRERLQGEHEAVRTLRAQHAAELRAERTAARRRNIELETQVNSLKKTNNTSQNVSVYGCDQCSRLKAEFQASLKQEKLDFKTREELLKSQLKEHRLTDNLSCIVVQNCSQCTRLKSEFEAELKKGQSEFKKKEEVLKSQLNKRHKLNDTYVVSKCEQCTKIKFEFEAELRKEKAEFKKKEDLLNMQLKEKLINSTTTTISNQCCNKLKAEFEAEIRRERSEFKKQEEIWKTQLDEKQKLFGNSSISSICDQCLKTKTEFNTELRKQQSEFKKKEDLLEAQLKEKQKLLEQYFVDSNLSTKCEQCIRFKGEFDSEIRKQQYEFKKKEDILETQLKEKQKLLEQSFVVSTLSLKCEQCIRFKSEFDSELRKQQNIFTKKEDLLKSQLRDKDLLYSSKQSLNNSVASCEQCARLKAEFEAVFRKEKSEFKKRESLLKTQLNDMKKLMRGVGRDGGSSCLFCLKLNKEIGKLKESHKDLEEKIQKSIEGDRLKAADLRTQHENHVSELSRITRSHKQEAHKLLEELKTKDRIIVQLKKDAARGIQKTEEILANSIENAQMRKLKEEARKTEQPALLQSNAKDSTFSINYDKLQDNENSKNKLNKNKNAMVCRGASEELEPSLEEDIDSAVSSAPSSLSPQPCSPLNDDCHPLRMKSSPRNLRNLNEDNDISAPQTSLSPQPSEGYTTPPSSLWIINTEEICSKNSDEEASELTMARRQVRELERALLVTRASKPSNHHVLSLEDRLRHLEEREACLLRELSDLREQNELLEFRVFELAEGVDKTSITTSDDDNMKEEMMVDACTNLPQDDIEQLQFINNLNDDKVRKKLIELVNKSTDSEDQKCILQVLLLLNGLEELREQKENPFLNTQVMTNLTGEDSPQIIRNTRHCERDRLVAKVLPFTGRSRSVDSEEERETDSDQIRNQEQITSSCGTQTETSSIDIINVIERDKSLNLTAEVRKLDKLRESIEVVGNRNRRLVVSNSNDSTNLFCCDIKKSLQRQLEFYQDRLNILERKVSVYESSGDAQVKQLSDRLNREIRLEAEVKLLTTAIQKLESDNSRLEEERCELEEAENDTRLRCQHLEGELAQLERSRMHAKRRAKDAKSQSAYWESMVTKYEERNYELEEKECELRHRLEILEKTTPQIMLLNMWRIMQTDPNLDVVGKTVDRLKRNTDVTNCDDQKHRSRSPPRREKDTKDCSQSESTVKLQEYIKCLEEDRGQLLNQRRCMENMIKDLEKQLNVLNITPPAQPVRPAPRNTVNSTDISSLSSNEMDLMKVVQELKEREKEMNNRINNLEKREAAYMETLQQADEIWAEMESDYKQRINTAEQNESEMRDRLKRLQKREIPRDTNEEDDYERELVCRAERLSKENNRLQVENKRLEKELNNYRDEIICRKSDTKFVDTSNDKKRFEEAERRLKEENNVLKDTGNILSAEIEALKLKLSRTANELVHLEVTNGELREEVDTLESKITEMGRLATEKAATDERVICGLTQELNDKDKELSFMKQNNAAAAAGERLGAALDGIKTCDICSTVLSPNLVETLDGVRTLCELVSGPNIPPTDDASQVRRRRFTRWL